jgi:hypothetical protein
MLFSPDRRVPSRLADWIFKAKATLHQGRRGWQNWRNPQIHKWSVGQEFATLVVAAESRTDLWVGATAAEWLLQAGKIHNLRLAIRSIDGIEIPAGGVFSFWQQVGAPTPQRGFVPGRELRQGCIVPTIGGGLCQLSNALYTAALDANLEILERHRHSQVVPGSLAEIDRDATVFWNYLDLRFKATTDVRIEATMDDRQLIVRLRTIKSGIPVDRSLTTNNPIPIASINNCLTCGVTTCFRNVQNSNSSLGRTGFLVDDVWVEFDRYLQSVRTDRDRLYLPLDGHRWRRPNYNWQTDGFDRISSEWPLTLERAYRSRGVTRQGARRQQLSLEFSHKLARRYGQQLTADTTHLTVSQSLLPWLWAEGFLAGRTFDVLMTGLPMADLQQRLDFAYSCHPHSTTLADFRTEPEIINWERAALDRARKLITPHAELASLYPDRTELLNWVLPDRTEGNVHPRPSHLPTLLLPGASLGRKGIYELRAATANLDVHLIIAGANLEGRDFWQDRSISFQPDYLTALSQSDLVVLPAWVEHQPRRILTAVAQGVPAIVSSACGLHDLDGIMTVAMGDMEGLKQAIRSSVAG